MRRGVPLDTLTRTLRHAVRSLLRHKTLSLLAVVCMGLGIGTCVTLFTAINPWLYRPLPYPAAGRLVTVRETLPEGGGQWSGRTLLSAANYLDWQARARSFDNMGAFERTEYNLSTEGEPERVPAARITASLLPTLGMAPAAGRLFDASEDRPGSAVACQLPLWQRRLGETPVRQPRCASTGALFDHGRDAGRRFPSTRRSGRRGLEVGRRDDTAEVLACLRRTPAGERSRAGDLQLAASTPTPVGLVQPYSRRSRRPASSSGCTWCWRPASSSSSSPARTWPTCCW
jgi:hypothetical protein